MLPKFPLCRQCTHPLAAVLLNSSRLHPSLQSGLCHNRVVSLKRFCITTLGVACKDTKCPSQASRWDQLWGLIYALEPPVWSSWGLSLEKTTSLLSSSCCFPCSPDYSWEPSLNKPHASEPSSQALLPGKPTKSLIHIFLSFHKLNLEFSFLNIRVPSQVCKCVSVFCPGQKYLDVLFLSHIGWLYCHSTPTLSPKGIFHLGLSRLKGPSQREKKDSPIYLAIRLC